MRHFAPLMDGSTKILKTVGLSKVMDRIYEVADSGTKFAPTQTKAFRLHPDQGISVPNRDAGRRCRAQRRRPPATGDRARGAEYEGLRDQIIDGLKRLRTPDTDEPLMIGVYRREEIFPGSYVEQVPDIIMRLHPMYRVGTNPSGPLFTKLTASDVRGPLSGWHDDYGIMIASGPDIPSGAELSEASLLNMAPTVMRALGLAAPDWMEGTAQPGIFSSERELVEVAVPTSGADASDDYAVTEDEEQSIKERLQNLGYL